MTQPHDPYDDLDDLASAHVDGQTTREEAARVALDADLAARVERMEAGRDALRQTEPVIDTARREQAIAAALAAFDASGATVHDRADKRAWYRSRRSLQLAGIAAVVALLALAAPLLGRLDSGTNEDQTALPVEPSPQRSTAGSASSDALAAAPTPPLTDLGPFSDLTSLADAVRAQMGGAPTSSAAESEGIPAGDGDATACPEQQAGGEQVIFVALAELDGRAAVVVVREDADGRRTLVVLNRADCTTISAEEMRR